MAQTFIVAGSDGTAVRVAEELVALGENVVVLSHEIEPRFRTRLEQMDIRVLEGDARDVADLREAGLDTAAALAIVEEDGVANLHSALAARGAREDLRLVVRMFNQDLGPRLEALFPDARILSASAIAAPAFLTAALRSAQQVTRSLRLARPQVLLPSRSHEAIIPAVGKRLTAGTGASWGRRSPSGC